MSTTRNSQSGLTLIEILVVVGLSVPILMAVTSMPRFLATSILTNASVASIQGDNARHCQRIGSMLRPASLGSMQVLSGGSWITPSDNTDYTAIRFRNVVGLPTKSAASLGSARALAFALAPSEILNGSDDDRDGLIDQGAVILTEANGATVEIAGSVTGFTVSRQARKLRVQLTSSGRDRNGQVHTRRSSLELVIRNN